MYLASKKINGQLHYLIRESYQKEDVLLSRDLMELGTDPTQFIIYPGGNAFYIAEVIEDRLLELGAGEKLDELKRAIKEAGDSESVQKIREALEKLFKKLEREAPERSDIKI